MRSQKTRLVMCASAALVLVGTAWAHLPAAAATFQGLGHLPGYESSWALAVNGDGSVVVGSVRSGSYDYEAFRWTSVDGMQGLGYLEGGSGSQAYDVSGDGSIIVGASDVAPGVARAFRWTSVDGMQDLGYLPGGEFSIDGAANAISADGSTIVGESQYDAFRWNSAGGMQRIRKSSLAYDASVDGSVVIGRCSSANGIQAFRWTSHSGMQDLPRLLNEDNEWGTSAHAINADGSVVIGHSGGEAVRWTSFGIERLFNVNVESYAWGVSADGSIIVGDSGEPAGAFIWDATRGARSLKKLLVSNFGLDLTGWELGSANAISADGLTIVGAGTNPLGETEAWIATLPALSRGADINIDGQVNAADIDMLSASVVAGVTDLSFDLNADGAVNGDDRLYWVHELKKTWFGDATLDSAFDSTDLVAVFTAGKYETGAKAGWPEGDWNGDARFDTSDLVFAFQDGGFEQGLRGAVNEVPEPTNGIIPYIALLCGSTLRRRR